MRYSKYTNELLIDALEIACGNVTHAAFLANTTKTHMMRMLKQRNLRDYALSLRLLVGRSRAGGRPKVAVSAA